MAGINFKPEFSPNFNVGFDTFFTNPFGSDDDEGLPSEGLLLAINSSGVDTIGLASRDVAPLQSIYLDGTDTLNLPSVVSLVGDFSFTGGMAIDNTSDALYITSYGPDHSVLRHTANGWSMKMSDDQTRSFSDDLDPMTSGLFSLVRAGNTVTLTINGVSSSVEVASSTVFSIDTFSKSGYNLEGRLWDLKAVDSTGSRFSYAFPVKDDDRAILYDISGNGVDVVYTPVDVDIFCHQSILSGSDVENQQGGVYPDREFFLMGFFTDLHYSADGTGGTSHLSNMTEVFAQFNESGVDAVIGLGDTYHGDDWDSQAEVEADITTFELLVDDLDTNIVDFALGNHEHTELWDVSSSRYIVENKVYDRGDYRVVIFFNADNANYGASAETLSWLTTTLASARTADKKVIICTHKRFDTDDSGNMIFASNSLEIRTIVNNAIDSGLTVLAVFQGHYHDEVFSYDVDGRGVDYYTLDDCADSQTAYIVKISDSGVVVSSHKDAIPYPLEDVFQGRVKYSLTIVSGVSPSTWVVALPQAPELITVLGLDSMYYDASGVPKQIVYTALLAQSGPLTYGSLGKEVWAVYSENQIEPTNTEILRYMGNPDAVYLRQQITGGTITIPSDITIASWSGSGSITSGVISGTVYDIIDSSGDVYPFGSTSEEVVWNTSGGDHLEVTGLTVATDSSVGSNTLNAKGATIADSGTLLPAGTSYIAEEVVAPSGTVFVNGSTGLDTNDGLTQGTAIKTIQAAIAIAGNDSVIEIAEGVYDETYNGSYGLLLSYPSSNISIVGIGNVIVRSSTNPGHTIYTSQSGLKFYNITFDVPEIDESFIYINASGGIFFYGCTFDVSSTGSGSLVHPRHADFGECKFQNCVINVDRTEGLIGEVFTATTGGTIVFEDNDIVIGSLASSYAGLFVTEDFVNLELLHNTIDITGVDPAFDYGDGAIVRSMSSKSVIVNHNTYTNHVADSIPLIYVFSTSGVAGRSLEAIGNHTTTRHSIGYVIGVGNENAAGFNTIAATVTDNVIVNEGEPGGLHAIFIGFSSDAVIMRNRVINSGYGTILKGDATSDHSNGQVFGNIYIDCKIGVYIKAAEAANIYNNTFIARDGVEIFCIYMTDNSGLNMPSAINIKNNAFDLTDSDSGSCFILNTIDYTSISSDYNLGTVGVNSKFEHNTSLTSWQVSSSGDANSSDSVAYDLNDVYSVVAGSPFEDSGTNIALPVETLADIHGRLIDFTSINIGASCSGPVSLTFTPNEVDVLGGALTYVV